MIHSGSSPNEKILIKVFLLGIQVTIYDGTDLDNCGLGKLKESLSIFGI